MPSEHAVLSASSAHRWLNCPGSVQLTKDMPDTKSGYAAAGTLAHSIGELKLRKRFLTGIGPKTFQKEIAKLTADPLYDPEMAGTTDAYQDYVEEIYMGYREKPYMVVEKRVDYSDFVPGGFGTADCIIIGGGVMDVIDYKHGAGVPVSAEDNPQAKLYALGALMEYRHFYDISTIRLHIFQPRVSAEGQRWESSRDALIDWAVQTVRPIAKQAYEGCEIFCEGDWCRFCKAKATCRARSDVYTALEDFGCKTPALLSLAEIGQILAVGRRLAKWVGDLEEYSLSAALRGEIVPGWKVVEGRRSRSFDNTDAAFADLIAAGVEEALLFERRPLTLAQTEKVLGKARFEELAGKHIAVSPGKPALVPESDKRQAYNSAAQDFGGAADG